jgi:hypothetical protein
LPLTFLNSFWFLTSDACMMSVKLSLSLLLTFFLIIYDPEILLRTALFKLFELRPFWSAVVLISYEWSFGSTGRMICLTAWLELRLHTLGMSISLTMLLVKGYISSHCLKKLKFIPSTLGL